MRISASVEYGARILVQLGNLEVGRALTGQELSDLENIPRAYVDQILHRLRRAGLVDSHRGARGGYFLARPAEKISLGLMMRAIEGSIFEDVCQKYASGPHQCNHLAGCGIRPMWQRLTRLVEDYLDQLTLSHLLEDMPKPFEALRRVEGRAQGCAPAHLIHKRNGEPKKAEVP